MERLLRFLDLPAAVEHIDVVRQRMDLVLVVVHGLPGQLLGFASVVGPQIRLREMFLLYIARFVEQFDGQVVVSGDQRLLAADVVERLVDSGDSIRQNAARFLRCCWAAVLSAGFTLAGLVVGLAVDDDAAVAFASRRAASPPRV